MQNHGLEQFALNLGAFSALLSLGWFGKIGSKPHAPLAKAPETQNDLTAAPTADSASLPNEAFASSEAKGRRAEEIAAISAVMAILMSEGMAGKVTAVRQVGSKFSVWAFAGRRDLMAGRL